MKKLLFVLTFIVFSLFVKSQNSYKISEIRYEKYENNEWVVKTSTNPDSVYVIINKFNIKITDKEESTFEVYGESSVTDYKTHRSYIWGAHNKINKLIVIMFKTDLKSNEIIEMSIIYDRGCFAYKFYYYLIL